MDWLAGVKGEPLTWLLEEDHANPAVRYLALRQLKGVSAGDPEALAARRALTACGPVPTILAAQHADGYWAEPGVGYYPKYRGTVWQIMFLAHLAADGADPRVRSGVEYLLAHARTREGAFTATGTPPGVIYCLEGNLGAALANLGFLADDRLARALELLACSITGDWPDPSPDGQAAVRYYKSGKSGPWFACAANGGLPCAWGAVKAMLALGKVPPPQRTAAIKAAVATGSAFLLSRDPAVADYPSAGGGRPSRSWFQFGFPLGYVTDVLQNLEALALLGYGADPRLERALALLLDKQDEEGRWQMEYTYNGKTWVDIEEKRKPSKWVTLRALRVLKLARGAR